jgi:hypothetical protein
MDTPKNAAPKNKKLKSYVQYSGLGFQMIAIIGIFTFAGIKLDENQGLKTPIYTAFLSLVGVLIALYTVLKSLKNI